MNLAKISVLLFVLVGVAASQSQQNAKNEVDIFVRGSYRYILANGIPDHTHGRFPNRRNPNSISPQNYVYRVATNPRVANRITSVSRGKIFGVALNGVPFDPGTAEYWQGDRNWRYEALSGKINLGLDSSNAHVQPNGAYHYHGIPKALVKALGTKSSGMVLVGYAADGFPIYSQYGYKNPRNADSGLKKMTPSYQIKSGRRASGPSGNYDGTFVQDYEYIHKTGDLDECNGRFGVTPEYPGGIYHYYLTDKFPFIPRKFRGTPDDSMRHSMSGRIAGNRPGGNNQGPGGPQGFSGQSSQENFRGQRPPRRGNGQGGFGQHPPHHRHRGHHPPHRRFDEEHSEGRPPHPPHHENRDSEEEDLEELYEFLFGNDE